MGSTYRGPVYGCPIKRVPLREPYEEGTFEMMVEGPFWIVFFFVKGSFWLWKRLYAGCLLEEGPFADGPVWMASLQRAA